MEKIKIGMIINVFWEHIDAEYDVKVLYIPQATGDSWVLKRTDGTVIIVNTFCKMVVKG